MENDQSQDKIAQASYKKIQEARKKGHIPRSRDFSSFAVLFCGFLCLIFYFYFNQDFYKLANFNFQIYFIFYCKVYCPLFFNITNSCFSC